MPSLFGKSHLYRYDIQGGAKSHYLVFVHLPCLQTHLKHLYNLSLLPINEYEQQTIECLMNYNSLTRDCISYLSQRLQIRNEFILNCFGLSYFNKINNQSYWLDPDVSMKQQLPKTELKPNLTFTFLIYPSIPYSLNDDKARLILYQQIFCNFISSFYTIPKNLIETLAAYFLRGCYDNKFNPEKNRDILRLIISSVGLSEENSDGIKEKIIELYRDLNGIDMRSAQNQFINQIAQSNTYGMIHFELKNTLNEAVCLGLNHNGIHSRSLLRNEFKLEACWHNVTSISSNKHRQITIINKNSNINIHTLIYYTDSTSYNRYCLRLLHLFLNHFSKYSSKQQSENITPKLETPPIKKPRLLIHGASVPDLRSDGESLSNDRTPPSISSSTRSSNNSSNIWTGSLPNLTVQLTTHIKDIHKKKNDPYATFADNLNHIDQSDTISPIIKKEPSPRHSLPIPYRSQSPIYNNKLSDRSLLISTTSIGLSCSFATFDKTSVSPSMINVSKISSSINLSPCFSCECLHRGDKDSIRHSPSNVSTITTNSRSLLNSRTYLSSTAVPLEVDTVSVHGDAPTDTWLSDFESKLSKKTIYDEFDSIPLARINSSIQDGRLAENARRNRYADVIPYDDTRVRLIPTKDNLHGYINASHVKVRVDNTIYSYIAAESPLPLTVYDFWRMISGSNVHVIVMLIGNDPQLCANYFPKSKNEKCRTDEFEIELISEQNRENFQIRHLKMKVLNGQRTRTIVHLQYTAWDEAQTPIDTASFIDFVNVANSFRRHYGETNPCLVHCTAGIGRTGIFILIHVMIQCITFNKKVSVASVLKVMREHRMSLVDRTYSLYLIEMVGMTNESPTFCFDRDELSTTDFNVDAFVVKYKREFGLEKLRDDLDLFLRVLKSSMVDLINRDFADFLNLSTNLVGFDKSITTLKTPLTAMKTDIMKINESLNTQRKLIEEKLREQQAIRQRRQVIQSIIDIQKAVQQLNELDDAINLSKIDMNEMIERAVVQFSFISIQLEKCDKNESTVESLKSVIDNLRRVFEKRLTTAFINAYKEPNMSLLADSLKGLASISLQTVAEQTFANEIVRPYMEKTVQNALIQSTDISSIFSKTLDFIRTECKAMLYVVERINRECGSHFDFVVNSIFPELTQCLEQSSQTIFFTGDPDVFHEKYTCWLKFIEELQSILSKSGEQNLKNSKTYQEFSSRWDLVIYYQIRFQEISSSIENILLNQPFGLNEDKNSVFKTLIASTIFQSINRCWNENVFLEPLSYRFWKLTLQCIVRFRIWIETFNTKTVDTKSLLYIYVDLKTFSNEVKKFFQTIILGQRLASIISLSPNVTTELTNILDETLLTLTDKCRLDLKNLVIAQLIERCNETLHSVQDIPRMYRKTNREAPTKPSNCIVATFRHLQTFSNDYSGTILTEDECKQFLTSVMEEITKNYYELSSEILSSVRKMEDSIQRLRRVRESSKLSSNMPNSMSTSTIATLTDDNKIRMQIQNDVNAFTNELEKLGINIESSNKLTILNEESRLQI